MPDERKSNWQRLTASVAHIIVRFWPEETQAWGRAFEAELPEIETPLASLRWLTGGLMLLTRERFKFFLRSLGRPLGVPSADAIDSSARKPSFIPRVPRFVVFLLLLVSAGILLHPDTGAALRILARDYRTTPGDPQQWHSVQRLQKLASQNHDPQLIAFASLLSWDENKTLWLADEAIRRDPSLTWIDYENARIPSGDLTKQHSLPLDRITRLLNWDPDNAILRLLAAETKIVPLPRTSVEELFKTGQQRPWEPLVAQNPAWPAAMGGAFSASKYDGYESRKLELIRGVTRKYRLDEPQITLVAMNHFSWRGVWNVRAYRDLLLNQAADAEHKSDFSTALMKYQLVARFARLVRSTGGTRFDRFLAYDLGSEALPKLQTAFEKAGHSTEAALVGREWTAWQAERETELAVEKNRYHNEQLYESSWTSAERTGLVIQSGAFFVLIFLPLTLLSLVVASVLGRSQWALRTRVHALACRVADASPILLTITSGILLFAYLPSAQAYRSFLSRPLVLSDYEPLMQAASAPSHLPVALGNFIRSMYGPFGSFVFWAVTIALLSVAGLYLLLRHLPFRRAS